MKRLFAALLLILVIVAARSGWVHADVTDFVINEFKVDYYLTRDDKTYTKHLQIGITATGQPLTPSTSRHH